MQDSRTPDIEQDGMLRSNEHAHPPRGRSRMRFACLAIALHAVLLGSLTGPEAGGAQLSEPRRVVAIGDIHADVRALRESLQLAGAIDDRGAWIGGRLTVVQLGDLIGRGDDERQVLDFIFAIQRKAAAAGGVVYALIGNHEVFGARVDNQAVGRNPFAAYEHMEGLRLDDPRLQLLPSYARARGAALMAGGPYARRLAALPVVLELDGTVFVHGGVVPRWARYGIGRINREVSEWFLGLRPEPDSAMGVDDGDRPMWTRQFSSDVDAADCALLDESLRILDAKRMVVAHTVHPEITARCDGRVWAVDVGMSRVYGGPIQVLEIVDGRAPRVIRRDDASG